MKKYVVEFDDKVAEQVEEVARNVAQIPPERLIELVVIKKLAPFHEMGRNQKEEW